MLIVLHYDVFALLQGLHASVSILDAELVSIDREQQCVVLSDKHELLYGLLLLTVGLDRNADLPEQQHEHASTILSAQELLQNMPKVSCTLLSKCCVHWSASACLAASSISLYHVALDNSIEFARNCVNAVPRSYRRAQAFFCSAGILLSQHVQSKDFVTSPPPTSALHLSWIVTCWFG